MREADVYRALDKVTRLLDAERIPYALVGALALNEYGYQRTTIDVNLLLSAEGLARFKQSAMSGVDISRSFPVAVDCEMPRPA